MQLPGEVALDAAATSIDHATRDDDRAHPIAALTGCALMGAALGALSVLVIPHRVIPVRPLPGLSILLAPPLTGLCMRAYGRLRARRGGRTSVLATFAGGSAAALAFSAVRLFLLRLIG